MGSGCQSPQSLSLSSFGKVRDPSFSSYLNGVDGQVEVKQAELTRQGNGSEKHISADEEIGVFRAAKYFNEGLEIEQKSKESVLRMRRPIVEGNKDGLVYSPVRSKISLDTPSIRSESSSRNNQTALLQGLQTKMVPERRSTGDVNRKKGLLVADVLCQQEVLKCRISPSLKDDKWIEQITYFRPVQIYQESQGGKTVK